PFFPVRAQALNGTSPLTARSDRFCDSRLGASFLKSWNSGSWWNLFHSSNHGTAASGRDSRVDALRGLMLVVMTLDHLPAHPLLRLTKQSLGFVSAAEGFVFLSDMVSAWTYGKVFFRQGAAALRRRAWSRARDLYITHVLIYTIALVAGRLGGHSFGGDAGF